MATAAHERDRDGFVANAATLENRLALGSAPLDTLSSVPLTTRAGGFGRRRLTALGLLSALAAPTGGCALMPRELNLSPIWFHRLDENHEPLEWDALWPLLHYERTPEGGDDFRIRPFYRRVTEPELQAVEHQFLWPLGRIRTEPDETYHRLFPLWSWRNRENDDGERDVDWYLTPLIYGGYSSDARENYFAFLPFYADIPQFLTYSRFFAVMFPFFLQLDKGGHRHTLAPWPLVAWSSCAEAEHSWYRVLPLFSRDAEPGRFERTWLLWPFLAWGTENLDVESRDPVKTFWLWPFWGHRKSRDVDGWTVAWPFFEKTSKRDHFYKLNLFWPFFHYYENRAEDNIVQWWLWPFVGHVRSDDQNGWSFLWPLIWWREYDDPEGRTQQEWVLPFFWHVRREAKDGSSHDFTKLWPFGHHTVIRDPDGRKIGGNWSLLSPWPWREGNAYGVREAYGWLWELIAGWRRGPTDNSVDVAARLFTRRVRDGKATASVPFLFNLEEDEHGGTLRLFQFIPIPFGGGAKTDQER